MSNSINWGRIYCFTEFGEEQFTIAESIPAFSAASCFVGPKVPGQIETLAITIDSGFYKMDLSTITADQTVI